MSEHSPEKPLPCPRITRGQKRLTEEQEAYAQRLAQERIACKLSPASINEAEAEEHLRQAYRVAGLEPVPIRWFDSPLAFVQAHSQLWDQIIDQIGDGIRDQIGDGIRDQIMDQIVDQIVDQIHNLMVDGIREWVGERVDSQLRNPVGERIMDLVGHRVIDQIVELVLRPVGDQVMTQVGHRVRFQVMAQVGDQVGDQLRALVGERVLFKVIALFMAQAGSSVQTYCDEPNYSACHFFHEIFEPNNLIHLVLFNQMVSGYLPGRKEAWLVRKPILLSRDEQGRLHSVSSMCMQYRDGWGFYAWHGVRCSEKIILEPDRLTREDWMQERNLELRRIIQERLGNDRFVELIGGTIIDRGKRGDLVSVDLLDDPEQEARFVHVRCPSTARRYYLRVPPTVTRADEAVAWTFGLEAGDYQPLQET